MAGGGALLYQVQPGYDAASNVIHLTTTLPGTVTDNQSFCYDEQNRLTWASSYSGTGPCGLVNNGGSLAAQGAKYTASYTYDALNRLSSAPLGSYTYGDPAHLHAATAVGSGYTASYDAAGNMTCRAPNSGATCAGGTPTGAGLGYTNEGQLTAWQNTLAGTPSTATHAAYDGEGHRVASNVQSNGVTTSTTDYLAGGLEEVTTAGSTTTLTKYESVPGVCSVVIVGSGPSESLSYVTTDGLGSVSEALDGSGNVTAQQLYGPYGGVRYSSGAMPTAKGYTGQYGDATTGLDYYGARYYDPLVGQFASADTANDGLNRYAYVGGNPEMATDPTGHRCAADGGVCPGAGGGGGSGGCRQCGKSPCAPHCGTPTSPGCRASCNTTTVILSGCGAGWKQLCALGYKVGGSPSPPPDKIAKAKQDAQAAIAAFKKLHQELTDLLAALELSGLWPILVATNPAVQAFAAMMTSMRTAATLLANAFAWQAQWADSMWTVNNVVLFQVGVDALLDFGDDVETVIGAGLVALAPAINLKIIGGGMVIASLAQDFVGNKMILDYTNKEADDLS